MLSSFVKYLELHSDQRRFDLKSAIELYQDRLFLLQKLEELCQPEFSKETVAGKNVLIKPNLVREIQQPEDKYALHTNINLILAMCELVLKRNPKSLVIAEAPLQNCIWEKVTAPLTEGLSALEGKYGKKIDLIDLRKVVWNGFKPIQNPQNSSDYLLFDLGKDSWLEEITGERHLFRITNYDPERLAKSHSKGRHLYCISKKFFESDLVITMPKLKTHQKAGLTCALKILVGINGDKDLLPHHRKGSIRSGGDCYPTNTIFGYLAELFFDLGNHYPGRFWTKFCYLASWRLKSFMPHKPEYSTEGNWYGNDTCWRMVMDLNKIAEYGRSDGTISKIPQRQIWSLVDAIVGGEGLGPLHSTPLAMSTLIFSNNSYLLDWSVGHFWRLSHEHMAILYHAEKMVHGIENTTISWNGQKITAEQLRQYGLSPKLPPGWINYKKSKSLTDDSESISLR